jgi:parvulin-like peptidyl-prolyl isomerase
MADKQPKKPTTRKHLVGLKREQQTNRILTIITAVIVIVVLGLVGWGLVQESILDPRVVVAQVEGEEITGRQYQARVRFNRQQLVSAYLEQYQYYVLFGTNPQLQQQSVGQMSQIQFQLQPSYIGSVTINQMIDDRLITLEAQKLGIEVSEEDVDREMEQLFGFFPNGTPTPGEQLTPVPTSTLSATQLAIVSVTPTPTTIPTLEATESEAEPTADGPTSTPAATATPITAEGFATQSAEYLSAQQADLDFSEEDMRALLRTDLYRQALFEMLTADEPTTQEQVWARHILVGLEDEALAQDILDQLEGGADWNELALEHSLDTSNSSRGGDLGWFTFDTMVEPFSEAAFEMRVGEISEPVESTFGWHIIQVIGHEDRPLTAQAWNQARNAVFQDWVQGLRNDYDWEIFEDRWFAITPDEPDIPAQYRLSQ